MTKFNQLVRDWPIAVYKPQANPDYQGNPFIEALPLIRSDAEAAKDMQQLVRVSDGIALPAMDRMHLLGRIDNFVQPLDYHVNLARRMSIMLRQGYVHRNPARPGHAAELGQAVAEMEALIKDGSDRMLGKIKAGTRRRIGPGHSLTLIGSSGVGKSTAAEAVLRCYSQVIIHPEMPGDLEVVQQILWLKLSVPPDGSIKALCIDFFEAIDELLGTDYVRSYANSVSTTDKLIILMSRVAFLHGLGLLVIDEIQNLNVAKSGGAQKMMNTFKLLRDVMKVPVLSIGTPEALAILSADLQVARRNSGLRPMERMENNYEFWFFCTSLFYAQFLRNPLVLTEAIRNQLYYLSQGIADVVVKIFVLAQHDALAAGLETIHPSMFDEVYQSSLQLLHPFLDDIRIGASADGRLFDRALAATKQAVVPAAPTPAIAENGDAPAAAVTGVKAKRKRREKGEPSTCLLVRIVEEAAQEEISAHQALFETGHIRPLGDEVLAQ